MTLLISQILEVVLGSELIPWFVFYYFTGYALYSGIFLVRQGTVYAFFSDHIEQEYFDEKLIAATRATFRRHVDRKDGIHTHVKKHEANYVTTIIE